MPVRRCPASGISGDGRCVVFASSASNLVAGSGNGAAQIYAKDLLTDAVRCLSQNASGTSSNAASGNPQISDSDFATGTDAIKLAHAVFTKLAASAN